MDVHDFLARFFIWPDGDAGKKDLKIKTSQPGTFMASLADDIRNEGNRQPITIVLNKLNEKEILLFVKKIQLNTPRYQLARNNCSHIIAQCLQAGAVNRVLLQQLKNMEN